MSKMNLVLGLFFVLFFSITASAHCDFGFEFENKSYCFSVEWQRGQTKAQGVFTNVNQKSPVLNAAGLRPEKWIYSSAYISVWKSGDETHQPVFIESLSVFPFMAMLGGMSHPTKSNFEYDEKKGKYLLSEIAFQEMNEGCWQLKIKTDEMDAEQKISDILSFENLDAIGNYNQTVMCSLCAEESGDTQAHDAHHDHN